LGKFHLSKRGAAPIVLPKVNVITPPERDPISASPIIDFMKDSGRKNTAAARWSALAAFLGFLAGMLGAYVAWPSPT
jgi:hypothetical protein